MKRVLSLSVLTVFLLAGIALAATFPRRDITNAVVWGAGGGTDVCNRVVSAEMAKILGVNVNVINKTGGVAGSIGMNYVQARKADGYTIVGLSESNVTAAVQGGWASRMNVWDFMIIGGSPDIISVTASSPYKTLKDLVSAAKKNPDSIKAAASGAGSIHHLNLLALMKGSGAKFSFIPYKGSAPSQTAAMTGEVTVVVTSVAEQQQLIRGGKLRPLGMLTPKSFTLAGNTIPSTFDAYPSLSEYLPISQAIGMAMKQQVPVAVKAVIQDAFKKALKTPAVQKWAEESYYEISGKVGVEAGIEFDKLESLFTWALHDLGGTKISPEDLEIPKP